jgi:hypothetical protein
MIVLVGINTVLACTALCRGYVFSALAMVVAAVVEMIRLREVNRLGLQNADYLNGQAVPMSVWWLSCQYALVGVAEVRQRGGSCSSSSQQQQQQEEQQYNSSTTAVQQQCTEHQQPAWKLCNRTKLFISSSTRSRSTLPQAGHVRR